MGTERLLYDPHLPCQPPGLHSLGFQRANLMSLASQGRSRGGGSLLLLSEEPIHFLSELLSLQIG